MTKAIAIIAGEPNSISSEIIFKSWKLRKKYIHKPFFIIGSVQLLNLQIKQFKDLLDQQFKTAKDYKPKIEWFEGTWSRYKPEKGKDKRGATGIDLNVLSNISNKINIIPSEINIHKTIGKILDNRKKQ